MRRGRKDFYPLLPRRGGAKRRGGAVAFPSSPRRGGAKRRGGAVAFPSSPRRGGAKRRGGLAALLFVALITTANAQTYPSHPVRLIVPFPPGGSTDILSRALAQKLSEGLAQPVVIDNRPGAGGSIGSEAAAKAAPDGYTLVMGQLGPLAVSPAIYKNLPYDPVKSFAPVSLMAMVERAGGEPAGAR